MQRDVQLHSGICWPSELGGTASSVGGEAATHAQLSWETTAPVDVPAVWLMLDIEFCSFDRFLLRFSHDNYLYCAESSVLCEYLFVQ